MEHGRFKQKRYTHLKTIACTHDRYFVWAARELRYANLEDGGFAEYRYNENGLRSQKKIYDDNDHTDDYYYFWSDDGRLLAYTVDMYGSSDPYSVLVLYNSELEPIGFTVGEDTYYYLKNIQGDVLTVTDAEGTPIVDYTYDAWGAMTVSPASQNVSNTILARVAFLNPVTYRGYFYDYELGLYYLQSRYYDPETGRFVSADIFVDTAQHIIGTDMFAYCNNNPVFNSDPTGYYSSSDAKEYAQKWWNGRNPVYKDYGEDADCTNFVSQCLYAGKLAKMSGVLHKGWHHRKYVIPVYTVNKWGMRYWTTVKYFQVSNAWSQAPRLMEWLKDKDHVESEIIITSKAEIKDKIKNLSTKHCTAVIFFKRTTINHYTHAAISGIVDKVNGNVYFYGHSSNRDGASRSFGIREAFDKGIYEKIAIYVLKQE